ncbi:MAG: tetratricopeptide repeat protein [Mariprofundaceae bacterium]|nr:tetratricopeptide repeat protein [Mariprofundaceae bacterium]
MSNKPLSNEQMASAFKLSLWGILFLSIISAVGWGVWQFTPGKRHQGLIEHAQEMAAEKAWGESVVALRKALEIYPDDMGVRHMLMSSLFAAGETSQGLSEMENMLLVSPYNDAHRIRFGEYYGFVRGGGQVERMRALAERMRKVLPEALLWMPDILQARAFFLAGEYKKAANVFDEILANDENDYQVKLDMAQSFLASRRVDEAEKLFKALRKDNPNTVEVLNGLATTLTLQGKVDAALDIYIRGSLIGQPPVLQILLNGGFFAMNTGKLSEAKKYFIDRLVKYYPEDRQSQLMQMRYDALVDNKAGFFKSLGELKPAADKRDFALLMEWCLNHDRALWGLEMLQHHAPQDMEADVGISYRIAAMIKLRRIDEAKKQIEKLSDKDRQALMLAEVALESGQLAQAEETFAKLAASGESNPTRTSQLAALRLANIQAMKKVIDSAELLPRVRILLGQGRGEEVLKLLAGVKQPDTDVEMVGILALLQLGRKAEAIAKLDMLLKQHPEREDIWLVWGRSVSEVKPKKALARLQQVVGLKADGPGLRSFIGELQYKLGQHQQAIETWQQVSERWPNTLSGNIANVFRAQAYMAKEDWSSAAEIWEEVLKVAPDDSLTLNNLAYCLLKNGNQLSRAKAMAEQALLIQPGNAAIEDTLSQIKQALGEAQK